MKKLIFTVGRVLSYLYPYKIRKKIHNVIEVLKSGYMSGQVIMKGENIRFEKDVLLYGQNIVIGNNVLIKSHSVIATHETGECEPRLEIGAGTVIGEYNHITSSSLIKLGNNVLTGRRVTITDNSHGSIDVSDMSRPPLQRKLVSRGEVLIGNNVWIGENAVILPGIKIGESAIIGASSVVTKDVPPFSVAVGNPAKVIKMLK